MGVLNEVVFMAGRAGLAALVVASEGCTKDKSACTGVDLNGDGTCETLEADWSATASIVPGESRENIYNLEPQWVETLRKRVMTTRKSGR